MRNRIMAMAMEEMNERGIKFTMQDLARRLGISKRTLYEYFSSKEDLIGIIVDTALTDIHSQRATVLLDGKLSIVEKLQKIITARQSVFTEVNDQVSLEIKRFMPAQWKKVEAAMDEQWDSIEMLLQQGEKAGYIRPVYLPVVRRILRGAYNEMMDYGFLAQNKVTLNEMKAHMADVILLGIAAR